ncbi:MAG: antitoxin [Desulfurococcales archaeon ex4484_42]|nr:MAG: antitoxin [Desulfurococcales archaeon ex4484_42]
MGSTTVISIRIPKWVKDELERLGIKYVDEIREYLIKRVKEERAKKLMKEMDELRNRIKRVKGNLAAEFIREYREGM